jgi:hypothetical protein
VHQPNLFPRISTLFKLYSADVWIVLDDVQFNARDYQNRAWLQSPHDGRGQWLTLATHKPDGRASLIRETSAIETTRAWLRLANCHTPAPRRPGMVHIGYVSTTARLPYGPVTRRCSTDTAECQVRWSSCAREVVTR